MRAKPTGVILNEGDKTLTSLGQSLFKSKQECLIIPFFLRFSLFFLNQPRNALSRLQFATDLQLQFNCK